MTRDLWIFLGGLAAGAAAATLYAASKGNMKPVAAEALAKGIRLKEKAADYAVKTKQYAEDIVAEAKRINESGAPQ